MPTQPTAVASPSQVNICEEWRDVAGFEGYYQVSSFGRVKSLERTILRLSAYGGSCRTFQERIRKGQPRGEYEHLGLYLSKNAVNKHFLIHRLVLETFVGPCPPGMEGCHFPDPSPANNRLDNLRWDTHIANMADAKAHGSFANNTRRNITPESCAKQSASIKKMWAEKKRLGIKRKSPSAETRLKISISNKKFRALRRAAKAGIDTP